MIALENKDGVVVTKWVDKREAVMLSTKHPVDFYVVY